MDRIRLTKRFEFEAAHSLKGYDGACKYIHGHSYILHVTICGTPSADENSPKRGMVMDFGILKKIVSENIIARFDHCLILRSDERLAEDIRQEYGKVELFDFQPTCENILLYFVSLLHDKLPAGVTLHSLKLNETAGSFAEWYASDNS